jgi:hypothetical protein
MVIGGVQGLDRLEMFDSLASRINQRRPSGSHFNLIIQDLRHEKLATGNFSLDSLLKQSKKIVILLNMLAKIIYHNSYIFKK